MVCLYTYCFFISSVIHWQLLKVKCKIKWFQKFHLLGIHLKTTLWYAPLVENESQKEENKILIGSIEVLQHRMECFDYWEQEKQKGSYCEETFVDGWNLRYEI